MEQYHRKLINDCMSELVCVTFNLNAIVDNLLEKTVINEWMKDYILVRHFILFFLNTLFMI